MLRPVVGNNDFDFFTIVRGLQFVEENILELVEEFDFTHEYLFTKPLLEVLDCKRLTTDVMFRLMHRELNRHSK